MSDKPSYLGLLNAVSNGESAAHEYLDCWIAVTQNDDVRCVLQKVSAREGEHGLAFAKRINELGYQLIKKEDPDQKKRIKIASSDKTDLEKMEAFGLGRLDSGDKPDIFDKFFNDHSIDPATGALLGRYVCEERDSGRILRDCYQQLKAASGKSGKSSNGSSYIDNSDRIASIESKIDAICEVVTKLAERSMADA